MADVQINEVDLLTQYNQHLGEVSTGLQNACYEVKNKLCMARDKALQNLCSIKRLENTVTQTWQQHKNSLGKLVNDGNLAVDDEIVLRNDLEQLERQANALHEKAKNLRQQIEDIEIKITTAEALSDSFTKEISGSISNAQDALKTHIDNIGSYIGGN